MAERERSRLETESQTQLEELRQKLAVELQEEVDDMEKKQAYRREQHRQKLLDEHEAVSPIYQSSKPPIMTPPFLLHPSMESVLSVRNNDVVVLYQAMSKMSLDLKAMLDEEQELKEAKLKAVRDRHSAVSDLERGVSLQIPSINTFHDIFDNIRP